MELKNYKFITGQIVPRPWGIEYRFTATKGDKYFDEIVMLSTGKEDEKEIAAMIERHLDLVSAPPPAAAEGVE